MFGVDRVDTRDDRPENMAVTISNIGFMISLLGDFTADRQAVWMSISSGVIYLYRATPRAG